MAARATAAAAATAPPKTVDEQFLSQLPMISVAATAAAWESPRRSTSFHIARKDLCPLPDATDLPESIYGAAMMVAVRSSQTYHKTVHGVTVCVFAGLIMNVCMQFYVLYCTKLYICVPAVKKVRELYAMYHQEVFVDGAFSHEAWTSFESAGELCQVPLSQPMFFLAILIIWTATCWVDLSESFKYLLLWLRLPQPTEHLLTEVEFCESENVVTTAASKRTKLTVVVFVLVPKVMIAMYLWLLGARWLTATTSFQDLMLNAVALAFITELDELIYMVVVPEDIQALVQLYKIARSGPATLPRSYSKLDLDYLQRMSKERDFRFTMRIVRMVTIMSIIISLPVAYMYCMQQVLPGYRWDVHAPCEARLATLMSLDD